MYSCPCSYLFAVDYIEKEVSCQTCTVADKCIEIKNKYQILNRMEKIGITTAREFIKDVFNVSWKFNRSLIENAKRFQCLDDIPEKNQTHLITYANIFKLMNTPLWKILEEGKLHATKKYNF